MNLLTERQRKVLRFVVDTHVDTAQPVGSRQLKERYAMNASAATLRHEMGALSDSGYLTQPHTSSGRVPTDGGYRYYVDNTFFGTSCTLISQTSKCLNNRIYLLVFLFLRIPSLIVSPYKLSDV